MPQAALEDQLGYDPDELPNAQLEVMGRGAAARKSKTLLPNIELGMTLGLVRKHRRMLLELFKALHAEHFTVPVLDDEGKPTGKRVPEELTDEQVMQLYPAVKDWDDFHQEQVEHYISVGGFSTKAAMGYEEAPKRSKREHSSAGAEQRQQRWS